MFIEDTITDMVRFIEDLGGIIIAMLIVFGTGFYFMFMLDPAIAIIAVCIVGALFLIFFLYAIVANIVGI